MAFTGILEKRPWAMPLEIMRLSAFIGAVYWMGHSQFDASLVMKVVTALAAGSLVGLVLFKRRA